MTNAQPDQEDDDRTVALPQPARRGAYPLIAERYEIRDAIGSGAGGEVFEAYDRVLGRLVAVKIMPIEDDDSEESRERLRRFQFEARAVSRLTHPNIMTVHDFGQSRDIAWIVMELVIGETLKDALRRIRRPTTEDAVRITCSLLSALHYAHERGIVHRDVKPSNILLEMTLAEGLGEVRLSDFGISRMDSEEKTVLGQMIGTPWVMAPEQLRGEEVDRRIDIWATGIILYEMLTGERPFKGSMPGIFHRIQTDEPLPPSTLRPDLPRGFDDVVAKALAKRREHRFATALEMAEAVRASLEAEKPAPLPPLPSAADPEIPQVPVPRPVAPRRRSGFMHGLLAGVALGAVLTAVVLRPPTPSMQAPSRNHDLLMSLSSAPGAPAAPTTSGVAAAAPLPPHDTAAPTVSAPETPFQEASATLQGVGDGLRVSEPDSPPTATVADETVVDHAAAPATSTEAAPVEASDHQDPVPAAPVEVSEQEPASAAPVDAPGQQSAPASGATPPRLPEAEPLPPEPTRPAAHATQEPALVPSVPGNEEAGPRIAAPVSAPDICSEDQLLLRSGNHDGFGRIVFEWRPTIAYGVRPTARGAEIQFPAAPCRPALETLRLPRNVSRLFADEDRNVIVLETARENAVSHHRWRGRLVLDVADRTD